MRNEDLEWYIIIEDGLYIGYTTSEYIANEYKRIGDTHNIVIIRYQSPEHIVDKIVYDRYGGRINEYYHIKPITTLNKKLVVLTSQYRADEYLYSNVDVSYDIDMLILSIYNMADFLDYFVDGDKLRVVIKIMIIKYIKKLLDIYYGGYMFGEPNIDTLYILAYNDAVVVIERL